MPLDCQGLSRAGGFDPGRGAGRASLPELLRRESLPKGDTLRVEDTSAVRYLSLLLIALSPWPGGAAGFGFQAAAQGSPVELTVALVGQQYCAVNPALTSLQMRLKLRYRN